MSSPDATRPGLKAQLETLDRVAAIHTVTGAIIVGRWMADAEVLHQLGRLVGAAEGWARRAG